MGNVNEQDHIHTIDITEINKKLLGRKLGDVIDNEIKKFFNDNNILRLPYKITDYFYDLKLFRVIEDEIGEEVLLKIIHTTVKNKILYMYVLKYPKNNLVEGTLLQDLFVSFKGEGLIRVDKEEVNNQFSIIVLPVLISIIMGNHKNVKLIWEKNAEQKRKWNSLNRGNKKTIYKIQVYEYEDNDWIYSYPIETILKSDDGEKGIRPFHSVRRHRRYYFPERPLFGKYSGWILIPPHHRGSKENGEIVKDYIMKRKKNVRRQKKELSN